MDRAGHSVIRWAPYLVVGCTSLLIMRELANYAESRLGRDPIPSTMDAKSSQSARRPGKAANPTRYSTESESDMSLLSPSESAESTKSANSAEPATSMIASAESIPLMSRPAPSGSYQLSAFERLPTELLVQILKESINFDLPLTSKTLMSALARRGNHVAMTCAILGAGPDGDPVAQAALLGRRFYTGPYHVSVFWDGTDLKPSDFPPEVWGPGQFVPGVEVPTQLLSGTGLRRYMGFQRYSFDKWVRERDEAKLYAAMPADGYAAHAQRAAEMGMKEAIASNDAGAAEFLIRRHVMCVTQELLLLSYETIITKLKDWDERTLRRRQEGRRLLPEAMMQQEREYRLSLYSRLSVLTLIVRQIVAHWSAIQIGQIPRTTLPLQCISGRRDWRTRTLFHFCGWPNAKSMPWIAYTFHSFLVQGARIPAGHRIWRLRPETWLDDDIAARCFF